MESQNFDFDDSNEDVLEAEIIKMLNMTTIPDSSMTKTNQQWFRMMTAFCYGFLAIAGLICNGVFCYVIWRSKKLHTVTHMLMTNLALSNILFLLFHPPFFMSTYILQTNWVFGTVICKTSFSVVYVTATGSFYFMSLVAIDRWLAIFCRKSRLNKKKCMWLTAIVWLIAFTVASPYIILSGEVHPMGKQQIFNSALLGDFPDLLPQDRVQCGIDCPSCKRVLQVTTILAQYGVSLFVMIPTYGHLAFFLWKRPTVGVQSRERFKKAQHKRRRMLVTLLAIVAFLILCWSPLFSVGVLHTYRLINNDSLSIYIYTSMVALLGVVVTPCFYLLNDGFRQQMLLIVPCCRRIQHDIQKKKTNTDNTSNIEKNNRSQEQEKDDNKAPKQCSPLLASGFSTKQSNVALTARSSTSDISAYLRKNSLDYAELPSSCMFDSKSDMVQL
uniref:G-protein coupled receptors family 1 profile domain-containing protein n=1 Tax=Panagrolaimus sp. JU765 TaxID=591449 RepID=A0AC34QW27_9BILA